MSFRYIDAINTSHFVREIFSSSFLHNPPPSISDLVDCYNSTLGNLFNKYAPPKIKLVHSSLSNPQFISNYHELKTCRHLQRIWASTHSARDLQRLDALPIALNILNPFQTHLLTSY